MFSCTLNAAGTVYMRSKLLLALACVLAGYFPYTVFAQVYVAPDGNDAHAGTVNAPKATLAAALRKVREMRRLHDSSIAKGIHVVLKGGRYYLPEPLFLRPEDAGTAESPTVIEAAAHEEPILSGGIAIRNWRKLQVLPAGIPAIAAGKLWVADLKELQRPGLDFRQLWVNNRKATRAKDTEGDSLSRILSWNHTTQQCWIPKPRTALLSQVAGMEMVIHQWWAIAVLRIASMEIQGDSARLSFLQPESRIQSEHPWPAPWISKETGNSAYYLTNAIQFLDQPGEWYFNRAEQQLYYWPRPAEDMRRADAVIPFLDNLLRIEGTREQPVSHVRFRGISFQHTGWLRPSQEGHVAHQAGMYMLDAYKLKIPGTPEKKSLENQAWIGRPAAAVVLSFAANAVFEGCRFEHLAATGLDLRKGSQYNTANANLFRDIGGTAILDGVFADEVQEIHLPYHPSDLREVCTGDVLSNNLITDVTNEDWGCVGIGAGYVRDIRIEHNDISEVSYTGISMGWGWSSAPNVMRNNRIAHNRIHHYAKHMYDCAAIYTLSAQPGTVIEENVADSIYTARYAHLPEHWFYLYTDEGSSYITVRNNWTPSTKFLRNANGPGNLWLNNGPQVKEAIKEKAGLQPAYHALYKERVTSDMHTPINHALQPKLLECVLAADTRISQAQIGMLCKKYAIPAADVQQWKNHLVLYGQMEDPHPLQGELLQIFPGAVVNIYEEPIYDFRRQQHCPDASLAKEWEQVILTAQLVKDTALQQEYIHYHERQFKDWPEVAKGFCNAAFQQLQVFKRDRQLMLVISIPKGKTLDELNPKTTENNPRVNEWNVLMKKYQEGIAGTKPGEVWVFFDRLNQ